MSLPYALNLAPTFFHPISLPDSDIKRLLNRQKDRISIRLALMTNRYELTDEQLEEHWNNALEQTGLKPKSVLWVREPHRIWFVAETNEWHCAYGDGEVRRFHTSKLDMRTLQTLKFQCDEHKLRSANILPKAFSRIFLHVSSIGDQWRSDLKEEEILMEEGIPPVLEATSRNTCTVCQAAPPCTTPCQPEPDFEEGFNRYWLGRYPKPVNVLPEFDWMAVIRFSYIHIVGNKPVYRDSVYREELPTEPTR